jgi:hypothetical protein
VPRPGPGAGVYLNPFRDAHVTAGRIDQGVDYSGTGPVHALGPGVIVMTKNPGWPGGGFIAERLTAGPMAGRYVYVAEEIRPSVSIGQHVDSSTIIGWFAPAGSSVETGWAAPPPNTGQTLAWVSGESCYHSRDPGCHPTRAGRDYSRLLASLGAPAGGSGKSSGPGRQQAAASGCVPAMIAMPAWLAVRLMLRRR